MNSYVPFHIHNISLVDSLVKKEKVRLLHSNSLKRFKFVEKYKIGFSQ